MADEGNSTSLLERRLSTLMQEEVEGRISVERIERQIGARRARSAPLESRPHATRRAVTVGTALAVVTAALILVAVVVAPHGARPHARTTSSTSTPTPTTSVTTPPAAVTSFMPGLVQAAALDFPSQSHGVVFIQQCSSCEASSGRFTSWVAVTHDGGSSWTVRHVDIPLTIGGGFRVTFSGANNGWTDNGYVTHDGGTTWHKAQVAAQWPVSSLIVSKGSVWAISSGCSSFGGCGTVVLSGSASGSTLSPVATQPLSGYEPGTILSAGPESAYIQAAGPHGTVLVGTADGGRSWYDLAQPCPAGTAAPSLIAPAGPLSLWQLCQAGRSVTTPTGTVVKLARGPHPTIYLARSSDGGRHWADKKVAVPSGQVTAQPSRSAWVWTGPSLWRTDNGGASWKRVFSNGTLTLPSSGNATLDAVSIESETSAVVAETVSSKAGTYAVVGRTTDAGASWQTITISLPNH